MARPPNAFKRSLQSRTQTSAFCQVRMKGVTLALLLVSARLCHPCQKAGTVLICRDALKDFLPGCTILVVTLSNVGEISSTVLQSENLSSITEFNSQNCGITGIAQNAFSSLPNLKTVALENNQLSNINQNWFGNPAAISELVLSSNRIEGLNESNLKGFTNLTKLRLKGNMIQAIHPDSFSSQSLLADLDLSENRLTRLSPQIFTSLRSLTTIWLQGNPWDCSCEAQDFVASLKELNRSVLVDRMKVICETPPHHKGQPVVNANVCPTPQPPSGRPSWNQTDQTSKTPTQHSPQTSPNTETSVQSKPTDPSGMTSAHTKASVRSRPPDVIVLSSATGHNVTSSSTIYPTSTKRPGTTHTAVTGPCPTPNLNVCTLIAVIAVLCVLLVMVTFTAVMHRRNRSSKAVRPGCPREEEDEHEGDCGSSQDQAAGCAGAARRRSFSGVRAKSANAIILSSPFWVSEKDEVASQTEVEVPSEDSGKGKVGSELGAEKGERLHSETSSTIDSTRESVKQDGDAGNLYDHQKWAQVYSDVLPYLSIGTIQNKCSPDEGSAGPGQTPQRDNPIKRISTWPPTAAQWEARRRRKEGEGEEVDDFVVLAQGVTAKVSEDLKMMLQDPSCSIQSEKEEGRNINLTLSDNMKPPETPVGVLEEEGMILDPDSVRQARIRVSPSEELKSEEHPAQRSNFKSDERRTQKRPVTIRQKAENMAAAGSKAPSGGASPDDETLLSGNEYAFMDLLHEVVQNNGRWTRERWKQIHVNKQRR